MEDLIIQVVQAAPNMAIAAYVVYKQFNVVERLTIALIKCVEHCPEKTE